jgi:hypothetical protein
VTAREIARTHLRRWTTSAKNLPPGAALLEGGLTPTTSWAIRHPETGVVFGWHADPDRLALLYWESLAADDRCELVRRRRRAREREPPPGLDVGLAPLDPRRRRLPPRFPGRRVTGQHKETTKMGGSGIDPGND